MRIITLATTLLFIIAITGCQDRSFIYSPEIHQGRVINKQQVAHLRLGMSKQTVAKRLGSPALVGAFSEDHWIYLHTTRKQFEHTQIDPLKLHLYFRQNKLAKIALKKS